MVQNGKTYLLGPAEKLGNAAMPNNEDAELLFVSAGGDNDEDLCNRVRQYVQNLYSDYRIFWKFNE